MTDYNKTTYQQARQNMVEQQIKTNRVKDQQILDAFLAVPREIFVPKKAKAYAYIDDMIALNDKRCLIEPMVFARLLQEADLTSGQCRIAMVVGSGTGYSLSVLSSMVETVFGVEQEEDLYKQSLENIETLEIRNVQINQGPLNQGWDKQKPYDLIFIDGAVEIVPEYLFNQLADHGKLITIVKSNKYVGEARLYQKLFEQVTMRSLFETDYAVLPGFERNKVFEF